jgi:hypothetical protein
LILSGDPRVAVSGTHQSLFTVTQPESPVTPSDSTIFMIAFDPDTVGNKIAAVSISNNDSDEDPYTFDIRGEGVIPEIDIDQGGTPIADGGSYIFADTTANSSLAFTDVVFTIVNSGAGILNLEGVPKVNISGINMDQFLIQSQPTSPVAPSDNTTFTVRFQPTSGGSKNAVITIENNDPNKDPYNFSISGNGQEAEIDVLDGAVSISNGGTFSFDDTVLNEIRDIELTINNAGPGNLILSGTTTVAVSGSDLDQFEVMVQPAGIVGASSFTMTTINFAPTSTGTKTAVVTIENNDLDESPFIFTIEGYSYWYGIQNVEDITGAQDPAITMDGENVFITYYDISLPGLKIAKSLDGGYTWSVSTIDSGSSNRGIDSSVFASGDDLYVCYYSGSYSLRLATSVDGGDIWTIETAVSGNIGMDNSIAVSGNDIYISSYDWISDNLNFVKYDGTGESWSTQVVDSSGNVGEYTSIAVSGSYVYISYLDQSNGYLKLATSDDGGDTWATQNVATPVAFEDTSIAVVNTDNIYISYSDFSGVLGTHKIKCAISTDGGSAWSIKTAIEGSYPGHSSIGIDGNNIYISYESGSVFCVKSEDGGTSWISNYVMNDGDEGTALVVSGDYIFIGSGSTGALMFAKSGDGGDTWYPPDPDPPIE